MVHKHITFYAFRKQFMDALFTTALGTTVVSSLLSTRLLGDTHLEEQHLSLSIHGTDIKCPITTLRQKF
jgi:hypothetical protein